ncbi:MAG: DEAD/DEAH box helicase family protein [Syntrophobacterales bacterium]|nr:DEAD/DEAH box helicase family protein [Syntrophobacterales bacterium]
MANRNKKINITRGSAVAPSTLLNLHDLVEQAAFAWIAQEKANTQSLPGQIATHLERNGKLRLPQRQAIEVFLWLKFVGRNRSLGDIVRSGALQSLAEPQPALCGNATAEVLYRFAQVNELPKLAAMVKDDPLSCRTNWDVFLNALLHDFTYPNYLFSLPMGAGKTYLMAAFIYLDLHFARLHPHDPRFSRNFVVFAPQASKTAILPSLQTIRNFDPSWVLPASDAAELRRHVHFEILDSQSSKRRDKLHGNNPNLEKVNRLTQTSDFGLIFITNAEKVVMEKLSPEDQQTADPSSLFYDEKKATEVVKINALREKLSQIPGLSVILDEAHHFFSSSGDDEKKLKLAVDILNQHGHVCTVLGFSGTPYLKHQVPFADSKVKLSQIQLIVYHYSLADGIGRFLKAPRVIGQNMAGDQFVSAALTSFFNDYDRIYPGGTPSKIAFYCPSIEKLNTEILPAVDAWYAAHRPGREDAEIFRFYRGVKKTQKQWALPKDSEAIFHNLDQPHIGKRVILLVAIGTEGWDCKSLTAVALPRRETTKNFVLQTTCRCLREVVSAKDETALIALGEGNYETLDKELKENYALSIADLQIHAEQAINVLIRKPRLGRVRFRNIRRRYTIVREERAGDSAAQLDSFDFGMFKTRYPFTPTVTEASVGKRGLSNERTDILDAAAVQHPFGYGDFLAALARASWGRFSEADLTEKHDAALRGICAQIRDQLGWLALHPTLALDEVMAFTASLLMEDIRVTHEDVEEEVEIELLDWRMDPPPSIPYAGGLFLPSFTAAELPTLNKRPNYLEDRIEDYSLDPGDVTFNYAPYDFASRYEAAALRDLTKLADLRGLEFYYNGYRSGALQSLVIRTPYGNYTPDFLILKRNQAKPYRRQPDYAPDADAGRIDRVLILETKGKKFYDADFKAKEKFVNDVFLKHNPHFRYRCFVDDDDNNFSRHLEDVKKEIWNL